ncbi:hypothetical protein PQX77_006695 [Marasmius sp. AFHP31]|nr:hypothetical protein PQX77_006695 [Marasmius sp. AFHP31]
MTILLSWYLLAQVILTVWAEELSVPSSWVKSIVASREERVNRTAEAIDAFIASDALFTSIQPPSNLSEKYWPYGELLSLVADFDIFTNQTRYKRIAKERFLPALQRTPPDLGRYGYAATRAYLAYQDDGFLDIAQDYWASNRSLTLSDADVQSNSSPAKSKITSNTSLACSEAGSEYTLAGGTFRSTNEDDLYITTGVTADYLTLTASLATVSSNLDPAYTTLASQMGHFMRTVLYQGSGEFYSYIPVGDSDCPPRRNDSAAAVSDAAVTMQSLSLLTLNSKNDDFTDILREVARRATGSAWNSADGVLDTQKFPETTRNNVQGSQQHLRSYFNMALSDNVSDLKTYFRAYLAVQASALFLCIVHASSDHKRGNQYDALVKQATFTSGVPNLYGPGLKPEGHIIPQAQTLAITILLGGVISSDNATPPSNDSGTTDATTPDTGRAPIGAVVGGVVGSVLGLALVVAGIYFYLRRRRQLQSPPTVDPYPSMTFMMPSPPVLGTSQPNRSGAFVKRAALKGTGVTESTVSSSIPSGSQSTGRVHEATTAELVTILNQRLRNERWHANENPPEYHKNPY